MGEIRNSYVDVARGVCMLLIICIHTEVFGVIGMPLTFIPVPMFFFMSGFFDRSDQDFKKYISTLSISLMLPALIWTIVGLVYVMFLNFVKTGEVMQLNLDIYNPTSWNGPAWFLLALFFVKIFIKCLLKLRLNRGVIVIIAVFVGYCGFYIQLPFCIDEGLVALPLYLIGKFIYPYLNVIISKKIIVFLSLIVVLFFVLRYVSYGIVPVGNGSYYYPNYFVALMAILFTFPAVLFFSRLVEKIDSRKIVSRFGQNTLGIMLLHAPMCHTAAVVLNRVFEVASFLWILSFLAAYVIIIIVSYGLVTLINKCCCIMFGKRTKLYNNAQT